MATTPVIHERRGAVSWLRLNRPDALNAIDLSIIERFEDLLPEIAADESVRIVVVTGTGRAFCAGADLSEVLDSMKAEPGELDFLDRITANMLDPLRDLPKPVIAAINGISLAGGTETAMCADIVVAAQSATIGDGHANFGVYPGGGGAALLPRLVPHNVAKYLLLTGRSLSAEEMHRYGFVNLVVDDDALDDEVQALAEEIASKSPLALARMKKVANATMDKARNDSLVEEQVELRRHFRSWDIQEGLAAFAEKRAPRFEGR